MHALRTRGKSALLRTVVALLALVWGTAGVVVATGATPAYAAGSYQVCFPVHDQQGQVIDWICVPFVTEPEPCPGCPEFAIGFDHLVLPDDFWYVRDLGTGLRLLDQAATANPREAAWLRGQARQTFVSAAERLGDGQVQLGEVGLLDRRKNTIEPPPQPWLESAGTSLVKGLTLTQIAIANPDPQPWLEQAMAQFEAALADLTHQ